MSAALTLDPLDLAALLCSRVCHDLISPSGAIVNGLEVFEEASDEETRTFALELIKKSARMASARLQFCRIAFGAAGSAGAQVDLGDAEKVARGFIEDEKVKLTWHVPRALMPKNHVKLLLNMLLVATQSIPRGGMLVVEATGAMDDTPFKVVARGLNARIPEAMPALLAGLPATGVVDAHAIQPFYTGLLARSSGLAVTIETQGDAVVVVARDAAERDGERRLQPAIDVRESVMPSGLAAI
jgi:histidine phosphotransferase ChpT